MDRRTPRDFGIPARPRRPDRAGLVPQRENGEKGRGRESRGGDRQQRPAGTFRRDEQGRERKAKSSGRRNRNPGPDHAARERRGGQRYRDAPERPALARHQKERRREHRRSEAGEDEGIAKIVRRFESQRPGRNRRGADRRERDRDRRHDFARADAFGRTRRREEKHEERESGECESERPVDRFRRPRGPASRNRAPLFRVRTRTPADRPHRVESKSPSLARQPPGRGETSGTGSMGNRYGMIPEERHRGRVPDRALGAIRRQKRRRSARPRQRDTARVFQKKGKPGRSAGQGAVGRGEESGPIQRDSAALKLPLHGCFGEEPGRAAIEVAPARSEHLALVENGRRRRRAAVRGRPGNGNRRKEKRSEKKKRAQSPRIGRSNPRERAVSIAISYPASACLITPVPGSFVRTRRRRDSASGVPSATMTTPA